MFCTYCGKTVPKPTESWARAIHETCWKERESQPHPRKKYCKDCACVLSRIRGRSGHPNNPSADRCQRCKSLADMKVQLDAIEDARRSGGKKQGRPHSVFVDFGTYRSTLMQDRILKILYECSCGVPPESKDRHHHDYDKPLEIILLCRSCHMKWHATIRKHKDTPPPDSRKASAEGVEAYPPPPSLRTALGVLS